MLPDVTFVGVYCDAFDGARSFEHHGNFFCVVLLIFRVLVFTASGVRVGDGPSRCLCKFGAFGASPLIWHVDGIMSHDGLYGGCATS
jgi:hypothetical protein